MSLEARVARIHTLREEVRMRKAGLTSEQIATIHAERAQRESISGEASKDLTTQRVARMMELQDGKKPTWLRDMLKRTPDQS